MERKKHIPESEYEEDSAELWLRGSETGAELRSRLLTSASRFWMRSGEMAARPQEPLLPQQLSSKDHVMPVWGGEEKDRKPEYAGDSMLPREAHIAHVGAPWSFAAVSS